MKECIILAGGLGTRLQTVVNDRPKCMALVANQPFLKYILDFLKREKFDHVILSLGYKSNIVIDWINNVDYKFSIEYVLEKEPLGTGGAINYASEKIKSDYFYILNGDTFFDVDTQKMENLHIENDSDISLALKPMTDFDRYGSVDIDIKGRIIGFKEKTFQKEGLINGGLYLINKSVLSKNLPNKFSFEKEILEDKFLSLKIYGSIQDRYFIDIGIPTDYDKANIDFFRK